VELLLLTLEPHESEACLTSLLHSLSRLCRTATFVPSDFPFAASYPYISLACTIIEECPRALTAWRSAIGFNQAIEGFLTRKVPSSVDLAQILPLVWWAGASTDDICSEEKHKASCLALEMSIAKIDNLHHKLCQLLLLTEPANDSETVGAPFIEFLAHLLRRNRGSMRNIPPPGTSDNSVLVSTYFALLRMLRPRIEHLEGDLAKFPAVVLFEGAGARVTNSTGSDAFSDAAAAAIADEHPRLGGSFGHLQKSLPLDTASDLSDIEVLKDVEGCEGFGFVQEPGSSSSSSSSNCTATSMLEEGELPETISRARLLDAMINLFYLGVETNFKQSLRHCQNQASAIHQLNETTRRLKKMKGTKELLRHLKDARTIFRDEVIGSVRHASWHRVAIASRWKLEAMFAVYVYTSRVLLPLSERDGPLFSYVPEYYLSSLVESFNAIRRAVDELAPLPTLVKHGFQAFVNLLVRHFADQRVVNPDVRDVLVNCISIQLQSTEYVRVFEQNSVARASFIKSLLVSFDMRTWIPIVNIMVRLCRGNLPASSSSRRITGLSSVVFQDILRQTCLDDECLLSGFLNRFFSTFNWAITELASTMKELQTSVARRQMMDVPNQQRRCAIMFDLSIKLERFLEFFTAELPQIFLAGDSINLQRLCESVTFVLSHTTTGPDAQVFEQTLKMDIQNVSRAGAFAPIAAILTNLQKASAANDSKELVHSVAATLAEMDAKVEHFEYLASNQWHANSPGSSTAAAGSGTGEVAPIKELQLLVSQLREAADASVSVEDGEVPDEFLDPLMCTIMRDPVKLPSGTVVDRATITRHLLADATDPFNRQPLSLENLVPDDALKERITRWLKEKPTASDKSNGA